MISQSELQLARAMSARELKKIFTELDLYQGIGEATMLRIAGKRWRCRCGASVQTRLGPDLFRCNGCGELYEAMS